MWASLMNRVRAITMGVLAIGTLMAAAAVAPASAERWHGHGYGHGYWGPHHYWRPPVVVYAPGPAY